MDSLHSKFNYGRCPLCDEIIAVPIGADKVYCCYCGGGFLAKAATAFYDSQKNARYGSVTYTQIKKPHETMQSNPPAQEHIAPRMMTIREIAKTTGISEHGIRRMVKEGKIPAIQVGTKNLINISKVYELMDQGILGY